MKTTETYSAEETFALGRQIGQQAKAGEVYTLIDGQQRVVIIN